MAKTLTSGGVAIRRWIERFCDAKARFDAKHEAAQSQPAKAAHADRIERISSMGQRPLPLG